MIRTTVYSPLIQSNRHRALRTRAPRQRGVTLFELLIAMLIVGILAAIGVPTYGYITTSSRTSAELNGLLGALEYARSEAVREGQPVTVCVADQTTNPYSCAGTGTTTWNQGWLVFSDPNGTHVYDSSNGLPLRVQTPFTSGDTLDAGNNVSYVTFNRDGFANLGASQVTFTLHDKSNTQSYTRCLYLSQSGMMSTADNSTNSSCQ